MDSKIKELLSGDRRKSERLSLPLQVFYSFLSAPDWIGPIPLEDVGGNGLRFKSKSEIQGNTGLKLRINLSDEQGSIFLKSSAPIPSTFKKGHHKN